MLSGECPLKKLFDPKLLNAVFYGRRWIFPQQGHYVSFHSRVALALSKNSHVNISNNTMYYLPHLEPI